MVREALDAAPDELLVSGNELYEALDDAVLRKTLAGTVIAWSRGAEQLFGFCKEEIVGRSILPLIPAEQALEERHINSQIAAGASVRDMHTVRLRKDGRAISVRLTAVPARDPSGSVAGMVQVLRPNNRGQRAVFPERDEHFQVMADAVPVLLWMADQQKQYTYFNKVWLDFTGRSLDQESGMGWTEGIHTEDVKRCLDEYFAAFEARQPFKVEYRLRRHDGVYRWVLENGVPRFTPEGEFQDYVGSCVDITERTELERRAEAERQRLEVTLASIGDGVIVTDRKASIVFLNPVAEALTGWKQKDALGLHIEQVLRMQHGSTKEKVTNPAITAIERGEAVLLANHTVIVSKDGNELPIDDSAAPIRCSNGEVDGCVLVFRDVTERKRATEMHRRLAAIVESSDDAIIGKDLTGRITSWNASAERILGYRSDEIIGQSITRIIPRERLPEEEQILSRLKKGERIEHLETVRLDKRGGRRQVSLTISPIKDEEGQIIGVSKILRDITEQKKARQALRESQQQLALAMEAGQMGSWHWDLASGRMTWSKELQTLLGYAELNSEPVFEDWRARVHAEDEPGFTERINQCVAGGGDFRAEFRVVWPDGSLHWVQSRGKPCHTEDGSVSGLIGVAFDISNLKAAEERLEQAVSERTASLRDAIAQMEEFSYSVSHDLRTPVRAISGYAAVLLEDYGSQLPQPARVLLERVLRSGARMDALIQDVLIYSRVSRCDVKTQRVATGKLVSEIIQQHPMLQPPQAELIVLPLHDVLAHEASLSQVLSNLLTNAAKFVPEGLVPRIRVYSEKIGKEVRLWVEDNGIGIKPELQQRIFGMFERVYPEGRYEGTGIGLAIVRKATEKMGGTFGVESDGIRGSRFWVQLPAAD